MSEIAQREFEAYRKDDQEARSILDVAHAENRATTPEEDERFEKLLESSLTHKARADKLAEMDARAAEVAEQVRHFEATVDPASGAVATGTNDQDRDIIGRIRSLQADHNRNGQASTTEQWGAYQIDLEQRAIADFSDNGALYTTDFATRVAVYQRTASPWINLATVINADNGRPLNLPNETADPTAYTPGEGTAITESTPTIGSAALTTTAYKALSYVSMEAEEDELIGLLGLISRSQGRQIGYQFGTALSASILTAATNGGTATGLGGAGAANNALSTATFVGYEDLLDLKYGIAVPYQAVGVFVMSNGMIKKARKYRDGQGQYLWQPAIAQGQPATFDGSEVYEDPGLAAPASATKSLLFGDASAVVIKQMALRVATSADYRFNTDQVAIKSVYRAGGALPDAAALRYLVSANT